MELAPRPGGWAEFRNEIYSGAWWAETTEVCLGRVKHIYARAVDVSHTEWCRGSSGEWTRRKLVVLKVEREIRRTWQAVRKLRTGVRRYRWVGRGGWRTLVLCSIIHFVLCAQTEWGRRWVSGWTLGASLWILAERGQRRGRRELTRREEVRQAMSNPIEGLADGEERGGILDGVGWNRNIDRTGVCARGFTVRCMKNELYRQEHPEFAAQGDIVIPGYWRNRLAGDFNWKLAWKCTALSYLNRRHTASLFHVLHGSLVPYDFVGGHATERICKGCGKRRPDTFAKP